MGIPDHLNFMLVSLYNNQCAQVRTEKGDSSHFGIGQGVRQGCILSPSLFSLYAENIMRYAERDDFIGLGIGGELIKELRYADDTTVMATSPEELTLALSALEQERL